MSLGYIVEAWGPMHSNIITRVRIGVVLAFGPDGKHAVRTLDHTLYTSTGAHAHRWHFDEFDEAQAKLEEMTGKIDHKVWTLDEEDA